MAVKSRICLRGISAPIEGKTWESEQLLRAGRLASLEMVLDDTSVSRRHAEIRHTDQGWLLRDLGSTNGTFLNSVRLGPEEQKLKAKDVVQFGKVAFAVEQLEEGGDKAESDESLKVEATVSRTWEDALAGLAFDRNRCLRPGEQLLALVRAGHSLVHLENDADLLTSILNDAVNVLDAQRGAIVLSEPPEPKLQIRALATGEKKKAPGRFFFSQHLAQRCFDRGESILCCKVSEDPELASAQSIADGAMASVLCVLLRTPRRKLGVLHIDRSYWQKPFTQDDLQLADALAANVSAGIECAQLLRKQRELFYHTINILAQAVELRDTYTGGHTLRVTNYAVILGQKMELSSQDMNLLRIGTPLHDVGKIGIDDAILRKPGKLSDEEFEMMKSHTVKGATILSKLPELLPVIPIVRNHHERWDGKGYPDKLAGEQTPQLARIVAVADAFDAMTSDRPYRKGMPAEAAFEEVKKKRGEQFDPIIADRFLSIQDEIEGQMHNSSTNLLVADPPVRVE